jgi:hypothetical protein
VLWTLVANLSGYCDELFRDNFDSHSLGASINGLLPEVGPAWRASTPLVPSVSSITSAGGSNHQLTLSSLSGSGTPYVYAEFSSPAAIVQMSFDWHFPADLNVVGAAAFLDTPELTGGIGITHGGFFNLLDKPNIAGDYRASVTFYFVTDEMETRIDDLSTPTPIDGLMRKPTPVPISQISGFYFEMPRGGSGSMVIDNLLIIAIPEPSTIGLVASVALMALTLRCRSPHAKGRTLLIATTLVAVVLGLAVWVAP